MTPPTATTSTTVEERSDMTPDRAPPAPIQQEQEEELECQLSKISRGPNSLKGIPEFPSFHEHRKHILLHMAAVFRNWARSGYTEGTSGHISVRDPEFPDLMWMNPIGRHFALLNGSDMLCLRISNGDIVGGNRTRPANNPGYYIHSEIHKAKPSIHAICHAHTLAGRAWAAFAKPLDMLTQDVCSVHQVQAVVDYGGLVTAEQEGQQIAQALGAKGRVAILVNHGLLSVGHTVDEAAFLLGLVDRSCEIQLRVEAACAGNVALRKSIVSHELAVGNFRMASEKNWLYEEAQPDIEYEIAMAGNVIEAGLDHVKIDVH